MKKRIFSLFLSALLLVTVLCACGDESQNEVSGVGSDGTSSSGEPSTGGELVVDVEARGGAVEKLLLTGPTNVVARGEVTDEELPL